MKVVIQPEISVELTEIKLLAIRDVIHERKVIARVEGIPRGIILWQGAEYDSKEAQNWTNDSVYHKLREMILSGKVIFD